MKKTGNNKIDQINKIDIPNNPLKAATAPITTEIVSNIEHDIDFNEYINETEFLNSLSSRENVAQQIREQRKDHPNDVGALGHISFILRWKREYNRIGNTYTTSEDFKTSDPLLVYRHRRKSYKKNDPENDNTFVGKYEKSQNAWEREQLDKELADYVIIKNELILQINQDYDHRSEQELIEELNAVQKKLKDDYQIDTVPIIGTAEKNNIKYYTLVRADQLLQYVKPEKKKDIKWYLQEREKRKRKAICKKKEKRESRKRWWWKTEGSSENKQEIPEYEKEQRSERLLLAKYLSERRRNSQNGNIKDQYIRLNDNFDINITHNKIYYIPKDNSGKIMERPFRFIDHIRDIINAPISQQEKDRKLMAFDIEMAERIILGLPKGVIEIKPEQGGREEAQKIVDGYKNDPVIGNLEIVSLDNNRIWVRKREQPLQNG